MLTAIRNTAPHSSATAHPPERLLVVLVAGIGDFVMATPAIRAIAHGFRGVDVTLLTTPQAADLARTCPYLHDVCVFDLRAYRPGERGLGWRSWRRFWDVTGELRARRFTFAIDLYEVASWMGGIRMGLLLSRVGAARTAGRWSHGRGIVFGLRAPDGGHEIDAMLTLAAFLGCASNDSIPELWIPASARQSASLRLRTAGITPQTPYAVLHAGSNKPEARLPTAKAVEIGRQICQSAGAALLLTGETHEAPRVEELCAQIGPEARSLAGRTDLLELAAVLEGAQVIVTTDSGPMHMAAAVGTPTVALFGPGDPQRFGPRGSPGQVAIFQSQTRSYDSRHWHMELTARSVVETMRGLVRGRRAPADAP